MGAVSPKSLLIVDDSSIIIERVIESLKGHESVNKILTATDFNTAVESLNSHVPAFILLDIQLPGKSGIELLKYIMKEYPLVKVIMFSNLLDDNYIKVCRKIGAKYFIDKSKDFDLIPSMLNN